MALHIKSSIAMTKLVKDCFMIVAMSELRERIKFARNRVKLSMEALGKLCFPPISKNAVSLWETKDSTKRTKPKYENLITISEHTGASLKWLLSDSSVLTECEMNQDHTHEHTDSGGITAGGSAGTTRLSHLEEMIINEMKGLTEDQKRNILGDCRDKSKKNKIMHEQLKTIYDKKANK